MFRFADLIALNINLKFIDDKSKTKNQKSLNFGSYITNIIPKGNINNT